MRSKLLVAPVVACTALPVAAWPLSFFARKNSEANNIIGTWNFSHEEAVDGSLPNAFLP